MNLIQNLSIHLPVCKDRGAGKGYCSKISFFQCSSNRMFPKLLKKRKSSLCLSLALTHPGDVKMQCRSI